LYEYIFLELLIWLFVQEACLIVR